MYHLVYQTTNLINNKIYVGVHSTYNLNDKYLGSGKHLKRAIKKYGRENFERTILHYCYDEKQSLEYESYIVDQSFIDRKDTYNIKLGGGNKVNHTDNIRAKISAKSKGKKHTIEQNKRQSERMKGHQINVGRKQTKEHKYNISISLIGNNRAKNYHHTQETKERISNSLKETNTKIVHNYKSYEIIFPDGTKIKIENLANFCKEYNLHWGHMCSVANGKELNHKKFKCIKL